jgi:hypothetical protein
VIILIITPLKYVLYHEYPTEKKKKDNILMETGPGLGQAYICGRIKLVNGILFLLIIGSQYYRYKQTCTDLIPLINIFLHVVFHFNCSSIWYVFVFLSETSGSIDHTQQKFKMG